MNERIKELAEQAEKYALDNVGKGHYGIADLIYQFQFADTKMEKFAELIVRECAEHIRNRAMRAGGACTIVGEESLWLAKDLEEHFGVE